MVGSRWGSGRMRLKNLIKDVVGEFLSSDGSDVPSLCTFFDELRSTRFAVSSPLLFGAAGTLVS